MTGYPAGFLNRGELHGLGLLSVNKPFMLPVHKPPCAGEFKFSCGRFIYRFTCGGSGNTGLSGLSETVANCAKNNAGFPDQLPCAF